MDLKSDLKPSVCLVFDSLNRADGLSCDLKPNAVTQHGCHRRRDRQTLLNDYRN